MPPRKNKNKKPRKSAGPRLLSLGPTYPSAMIGKHRYTQIVDLSASYSLTNTIPDSAATYFSANGMYDVDREGAGHQPLFFDQMAAIYEDFVVLGSRVKVKFINTSLEPVYINLNRNTTTQPTSATTAKLEEQMSNNKMTILPSTTSARPFKVLTSAYSPSKQFGISKKQVRNDTDLKVSLSNAETVPFNEIYYNISVQQIAAALGGTVNPLIKAFVEIEYIVLWSSIKDRQAAS